MKIKLKHLLLSLILVTSGALLAQDLAKDLRVGILPNGLHYYILHSPLQKGEVSFYLNQKVGSILENDDQKGLAHFLEHMAFNGSTHFPDGVMNYLKSEGATTVNAQTGMDETVYYVENVSTNNTTLVDTCIYLLRDWCGNLLLKTDDINKERGIITEEWRTRNNAQKRQYLATAPYVFNNSQYAKRDPIGDINIIQNFKPDALRSYYKKWYNSTHQAVIIVGDIDPNSIEERVKSVFSDLKRPKKPAPRIEYKIPNNTTPLFYHYVSDEMKRNGISISSRKEDPVFQSDSMMRKNDQCRQLFNGLAQNRISTYANANSNLPYISLNLSNSKLVANYYLTTLALVPYINKEHEAVNQALLLWETIHRYGFTEEELAEFKKQTLEQYSQALKNISHFKNAFYVKILQNNFNKGIEIKTLDESINSNIAALESITLDELNNWIKNINLTTNQYIEFDETKKDALPLTQKDIQFAIDSIQHADIPAWSYTKSNNTLMMDIQLQPATISNKQVNDTLKNEVWHLSNGVTVIYKYTNEDKGVFELSSVGNGGRSQIAAEDLPSANALLSLIVQSGVYKLSRNELVDILTKNQVQLKVTLGEVQQGISGSTFTNNSESLFQLAYQVLTHPRFEKKDFDEYVKKLNYQLEHQNKTPLQALQDSIQTLLTVPNNRTWTFSEAYIKALNFESMKRIYQERFGNNANLNYYIVGDISKEEAQKMACLYLGNLPTNTNAPKGTYKIYNFESPKEVISKSYHIQLPGNKAKVQVSYTNQLKLTDKEKVAFDMITYTLDRRYFNSIRKAASGTYGVNVKPVSESFPTHREAITVSFETERGKQDALKQMVYDGVNEIKKQPITGAEMSEVVDNLKKQRIKAFEKKGVSYWTSVLSSYYERGENITSPNRFENVIDKITVNDVKTLANKFFSSAKIRDIMIISKPEGAEQ